MCSGVVGAFNVRVCFVWKVRVGAALVPAQRNPEPGGNGNGLMSSYDLESGGVVYRDGYGSRFARLLSKKTWACWRINGGSEGRRMVYWLRSQAHAPWSWSGGLFMLARIVGRSGYELLQRCKVFMRSIRSRIDEWQMEGLDGTSASILT